MEKQSILFNLDDTLVECNKYFNLASSRLAEAISGWFEGLSQEEIRKRQTQIDLNYVERYGLSPQHLPLSFVDTYLQYCREHGVQPDSERSEWLRELAESVFRMPVEPFPYMHETLEELKRQGHELYLHTGGEKANQQRKITQLQLAAYFDNRVFISLHKDTAAMERILKQMKANRGQTWMIGNSLRTDILPALETGVNAIYIPALTEWEYNVVEIKTEPKGAFLTVESLKDVPSAIEKYITGHERQAPLPYSVEEGEQWLVAGDDDPVSYS